jgi:PAS domain S-box-containing protein
MGSTPMTSAPESFDQVLPPRPSSVAAARGLVRELLTVARRDDLLDDAVLLVSEIVTNALIHAGSSMRVQGRVGELGLRVEVSDTSPHHPALRDYADTASTGRGLTLLVELVDKWGVSPAEVGKTVWFELGGNGCREDFHTAGAPVSLSDPAPAHPDVRAATHATDLMAGHAAVRVQLLMMPLLLHEAWREHAESLLREYLLASLDFTDRTGTAEPQVHAEDPIQVHADAMDAIALLEEQVPVANIDMDPAKLMADATEPRVTAPEVWVEIPETSVPRFVTLERTLERAFALVDSGQVVTPRTQPEIEGFRRWLCRQVEAQSVGRPPVPWSIDDETDQPPTTQPVGVALEDIMNSSEELIAADDANQVVAVSASAAKLLGYDAADELVGQRLVAIIPPRFHQAHIAGFTLHLLVGRSPLLGREVEVPAVRRDGTEVALRLEITPRRAPDGAALFVARMRASSVDARPKGV